MNRNAWRIVSRLIAAGLCTLCACRPDDPAPAPPPNILLVVLDTARVDYFSCYGHGARTTPKIDALAAQGARFKSAFATDFWTLPSHASLFTGLYPTEAQATAITNQLPPENLTLAEVLQSAGYATGAVVHNAWISVERGFGQGFAHYAEMWRKENWPEGDELTFSGEQKGVDRAVAWIDDWQRAGGSAAAKRPFFLFVNFNVAHLPYTPPPQVRDRFLGDGPVDPNRLRQMMSIVGMWPHLAGKVVLNDPDYDLLARLYEAELARADDYVGQLLDALDQRNLARDTLVIVTSDHGENLGDHGMIDHLLSMHDSAIRIPLIMRWPGKIAPGVPGNLASLVDIVPTLMHLTGLGEQGGDAIPSGRGAAPYVSPRLSLFHPERLERRFLIAENERPMNGIRLLKSNFPDFDTDPIDCRMFALRTHRFKLIWHEGKKVELFDLVQDPGELQDISGSRAQLRDEMLDELKAWLANVTPGGPAATTFESDDPESLRRLRSLGYIE